MHRRQRLSPGLALAALPALSLALAGAVGAACAQDQPPTAPAPMTAASADTDPAAAPAGTPAPAATAPEVAAANGRIRGVVTDPDKKPVGGRLVVLVSRAEGEALRVTSTDEKGRYHFRDLPPGKYEVRLEADGFISEIKEDIDVRPPFQNVVDVTLRRAATPPPSTPATVPAGAPPGQETANPAAPAAALPAAGGGEVVQGVLRDSDGVPVVEAEVLLVPLAGGALRQGTSDGAGAFRVDGVAPGGYRLIVRSLGHVPIDVSRVDVARGTGLSIRLSLVDYALDFVTGKDLRQVQERPRPRPSPVPAPTGAPETPVPPSTKARAPEPEPEPLVPAPPEEKSTTPPPADTGAPPSHN